MKKTFLILASFFGIATASAQSDNTGFDFGVRGGVNLANIATSNDLDSPDSRTSFYAGVVAELPLHERFSLQGEAFYSGQGFERDLPVINTTVQYKADYIQVPLLAKFYIVKGLSIAAGPQFGFKVNEKIDYITNNNDTQFTADGLKTFDMQGTAGLEYKLDNGLFIQGRYSYGFSDLIKDNSINTSVFSAGLGYMF
ncbi:porin family protein [Aequorivita marina]|uniref:porin family protein n=1 Tax=Aequorivita marina TaxID=3073654 RepID=UPI002876EA13|nr:porin family protein [Aequorivita sp. S2608]MDS1298349.1 porin family protein [Aequorivita sp. S2608]